MKKLKVKYMILFVYIMVAVLSISCAKDNDSIQKKEPCEEIGAAFARVIQNQSGEEYMNLHPDDLIQDRINGWNYTKEEVIEEFEEMAKDSYNYISNGEKNVKIKYKVLNKKHLNDDELDVLNSDMKNNFEFRDNCIKDAYKVTFQFYADGKKNTIKTSQDYVVKIDGKWFRQYNPEDNSDDYNKVQSSSREAEKKTKSYTETDEEKQKIDETRVAVETEMSEYSYKQSFNEILNSYPSTINYALYDINKDDIPELIVSSTPTRHEIYTCDGNTSMKCGEITSYDEGLKKYDGNGIAVYDGGMGSLHFEYIYLYTIENNKIELLKEIISNEEYSTEEVQSTANSMDKIQSYENSNRDLLK